MERNEKKEYQKPEIIQQDNISKLTKGLETGPNNDIERDT